MAQGKPFLFARLLLAAWLWSSLAPLSAATYIPGHNHFVTLDITTANAPLGRSWGCSSVLSLAQSRTTLATRGSEAQSTSSSGTSPHILLFGGTADTIVGGTWLYDVAGNSWWQWPAIADWAKALPSPRPRFGHTCTPTLPTSQEQFSVLFAGHTEGAGAFDDLWLFSAHLLEWLQPTLMQGQPPAPRWFQTNVFIGSSSYPDSRTAHRFLVFGGNRLGNGTQFAVQLNDLWLLDISAWGDGSNYTAEWKDATNGSAGAHWPGPRASHVAVWASNRQSMIVIGGQHALMKYLDIWECKFDVGSLSVQWIKLAPDFPGQVYEGEGYYEQTAAYWESASCVLLFGGVYIETSRALWSYCFGGGGGGAGVWSPIDTASSFYVPPSMTALSNAVIGQRLYLLGGQENGKETPMDRLWSLYADSSADAGVWFYLSPPQIKPGSRRSHTAVAAGNATMVVYGGATTDIQWPEFSLEPDHVWVLNVTGQRWTKYSPNNVTVGLDVPWPRAAHSAVVHGSNMWVFGGVTKLDDFVLVLDDVWRWSLIAHTWTAYRHDTALRPTARRSHTAVATATSMLVFGGISNVSGNALDDLWEFSFASNAWSPVHSNVSASWPSPRFGHTAVVVANNMIVFGGVNVGDRAADPSVWRYSSLNETWEQLSDSVPVALDVPYFHAAVGYGIKMIVSGGCSINSDIWDGGSLSLDEMSCSPPYRIHFNASVWVYDTSTLTWERLALQESVTARIMHTTVMIGSIYLLYGGYNLDTFRPPKRELAAMRPGCNVGHESRSFAHASCERCGQGTYSTAAGERRCSSCPSLTTTPDGALATSLLNCTECRAPACHGHGSCSVLLPAGNVVCKCQFGYISSDSCQTPVYYYLIFFALFGLIVLVSGTLFCVRVRRMMRLQRLRAKKLRTSRCELARLTQAWYIEESELAVRERIDMESPGSFGKVVLAEYREMPVAVKHLHSHVSSPRNEREFEEEVRFMRTLRHPNIVLFLGGGKFSKTSTIGPGGVSFLVMEYMLRGTLTSLLRNETVHVDTCQGLRFALDAAKGMRFLHSRNPPCIHRDLKSSNLLVSERWVVKVADFGEACPLFKLHRRGKKRRQHADKRKKPSSSGCDHGGARFITSYTSASVNAGLDVSVEIQASMGEDERSALLREGSCDLSSDVGTLMWQAPEMLRKQPYGPSADVYSFAIVLWEIAARKEPYKELPSLTSIMKYVLAGNRPAIPEDCRPLFSDLMVKCWQDDGKQRPTFQDIVANLDSQHESWSPQ